MLLPQPKQLFQDNAWNPLVGGLLYTYEAGTLTAKATYQDAALSIANTNPVSINGRGEVTLYGSGLYRMVLKDSFGNTIYDRDNIEAPASPSTFAASGGAALIGFDDTTVAGMFKSRVNRVVSSIADLRALDKTKYTQALATGYYAAGDGGGGVYYLDSADTTSTDNGVTIIVATDGGRWKLAHNGSISVLQAGARGDGITDDTNAVNAAIAALSTWQTTDWFNAGNPPEGLNLSLRFPTRNYLIAGKVLVPQGMEVVGENATLIGSGGGSSGNIIFETGYYVGGVLTTNIGTADGTGRVVASSIHGFRFTNCALGFNAKNWAENCDFYDNTFYNCRQNIVADASYYGKFRNCMSRGNGGTTAALTTTSGSSAATLAAANSAIVVGMWVTGTGIPNNTTVSAVSGTSVTLSANATSTGNATASFGSTLPAFHFKNYVNTENLSGLRCVDRFLSFQFEGEVDGQQLENISAEGGSVGVKFLAGAYPGSSVNGLRIGAGCYFENLTDIALNFNDASHVKNALTIDDVFFNSCNIGIAGAAMYGTIGHGNRYINTTTPVYINDDASSFTTVHVPPSAIATNGTPGLPSGWTIGKKCKVVYPVMTYDTGTGLPTTKTNYTGGLAELPYTGDSGYVPNGVPYCTNASSGGTSFSVYVDTKIAFNEYALGIFKLKISDNSGVWTFTGRFFGSNIYLDGTTQGSHTVTASNVGGFVRLTLGTFSHPSGTYGIEGVVRLA